MNVAQFVKHRLLFAYSIIIVLFVPLGALIICNSSRPALAAIVATSIFLSNLLTMLFTLFVLKDDIHPSPIPH